MFTHEKFEAYQLAIQFTEIALQILDGLPAGHSALRVQLKRAAFSVALNIAEGTVKSGRADRKRFYTIARGSAMECAATCDIVALVEPQLKDHTLIGKDLLKSVVSILSVVCSKTA